MNQTEGSRYLRERERPCSAEGSQHGARLLDGDLNRVSRLLQGRNVSSEP